MIYIYMISSNRKLIQQFHSIQKNHQRIELIGKPECWDRVPLRARATARPKLDSWHDRLRKLHLKKEKQKIEKKKKPKN